MRLPENHSIREFGCHGLPDAHLPPVLTADIMGRGERRGCGGRAHLSVACLGNPRCCTRNSKVCFPWGEPGTNFSRDRSCLCWGEGSHWAWEPVSSISLHSQGWQQAGTKLKAVLRLPLLQESRERQVRYLRCPGEGFPGFYFGGGITLKGSGHMERANSMGDVSRWQWRREVNLTERFSGKRNSRRSCKETQPCQHREGEGEDSEKRGSPGALR